MVGTQMNANELADELEKFSGDGAFKYYLEIAAMLRQQQKEIDTLRTHGYKTQYELLRIEFINQKTEIEFLTERNRFLESIYRTVKAKDK
jgi:hypothetical protein